MRLAINTTTLAEEFARRGLDWEEQLRQRAKEVALMKELELVSAPVAPEPEEEPEEDENEYEVVPARTA